ncbi:hypothetical protein DSM3645_04120 [Blastopirellula marina DSM 3645]|uniref:Uncharacterized protein n=2 Tax=Blastopirellula marina TaxID=124 RepID=A4A1Y3_9BACT|nr:hypothetical protein DSM3645_04120 [Blastopirellula marina DSM 3645]
MGANKMRDSLVLLGAVLLGAALMQFARLGLGEVIILYAILFVAIVVWRRSRVAGQKKR